MNRNLIKKSMKNDLRNCAQSTVGLQRIKSDGAENLLTDGVALAPALNMAVDSWLATRKPLGESEGVLRIYRWRPAGISIGRNQRWERALNCSALRAGEVAVRRITGGRAIYHDSHELTYSFVMRLPERREPVRGHGSDNNSNNELNRPVVEQADTVVAQKRIAELIVESLLAFLRSCGIDAEVERRVGYAPAHRPGRQSPHCFVSAARYEIMSSGAKIVASAQRIHDGRFFQHGSIKFNGPVAHPALYGRGGKNRTAGGNIYRGQECYTTGGEGAEEVHSGCGGEGAFLDAGPATLREAFEATFDRTLSTPSLTAKQVEEVFEELADIDSIVGAGAAVRVSSSPANPHSDPPHEYIHNLPHKPPHRNPHAESCVASGALHEELRPDAVVAGGPDSSLCGADAEGGSAPV